MCTFEVMVRKRKETVEVGDNVYISAERRNVNEHRQKLALVAEGPYPNSKVKGKTAEIERKDKTVKRISCDCVQNETTPRIVEEAELMTRPMSVEELPSNTFPISEPLSVINMTTLKTSPVANDNLRPVATEQRQLSSNLDAAAQQPSRRAFVEVDDLQDLIMNRIVSHGTNGDTEHPSVRIGETAYRVRWYGCTREDDTFEAIRHIPRSKVVSYFNLIKQPFPDSITDVQMGIDSHLARTARRITRK